MEQQISQFECMLLGTFKTPQLPVSYLYLLDVYCKTQMYIFISCKSKTLEIQALNHIMDITKCLMCYAIWIAKINV